MKNSKRRAAIHIGAGNIGRGLIVPLYKENDIHVFLIDSNEETRVSLDKLEHYEIKYIDANDASIVSRSDYDIISDIKDIRRISSEYEIEFISTSCGTKNFDGIKNILINIHDELFNHKSINVISFENDNRASSLLKEKINFIEWNYIDCIVDRIVPNIKDEENSLNIITEKYFEIVLDAKQKGNCLLEKSVIWTDNFDAYFYRKFWVINSTHLLFAYLFKDDAKYLYEIGESNFKKQDDFKKIKEEWSNNLICVLNKKFDFSTIELEKYIEANMNRFFNKNLKDDLMRLRRDPIKKLNKNERVFTLLSEYVNNGLNCKLLNKLIYLMLTSYDKDDAQSQKIKETVIEFGLLKSLSMISQQEISEIKGIDFDIFSEQ